MVEAGAIKLPDAIGGKQIAVGDHTGKTPVMAHAGDNPIEIGMQ